jgi:hypothetical protein
MNMKMLSTVIAAIAFFWLASPVTADPRDSVDRGNSLDRDAIRDDVRINRLKVPVHPLTAEQPAQQVPAAPYRAKQKRTKKSGELH